MKKNINQSINQPLQCLGGLTAAQFLRDYWQKKPLFVKGAFPNFEDPLSADEIAGLAFEEFIPSRFIFEEGGERPWELKMGPFFEEDFASLADKKWMLVVNDIEKSLPHLKSMLDPFRFIPNWRLDDLQASLGEDGGSVGAHWDDYDVFLIQGEGKKRWQISYDEVSEDDFVEGIDIRLIEHFKPDEEWLVEPGDLLYLPPRIGHFGINIGRSVTWSVGFRAPKHSEMLHDFTGSLLEDIAEDARFTDPDLTQVTQIGELDDLAVERVSKVIHQYLTLNPEAIARWFGQHITEPKLFQTPEPRAELYSAEALSQLIAEKGELERHPGITFLYRDINERRYLFAGGEEFSLPVEEGEIIRMICQHPELTAGMMAAPVASSKEVEALILQLVNDGYYFDYSDESDVDF